MRASTETLLSLYEWADVLGLNVWELAQFDTGLSDAQCQRAVYQRSWPNDVIGREEIAAAIEKAEQVAAEQLGFWPAPRYCEETVEYPRAHDRAAYGTASPYRAPYAYAGPSFGMPRQQWKTVQMTTGFIQGGGILARNLIAAGAAVTRDTDYGDGVLQKFTVSVATTVTDPAEIALYYATADRDDLDETWRIRPVKVALSGGVATITGPACLLVPPALTLVTNPQALAMTDAAHYVTTVDVYRIYRDATATDAVPNQGWALWEPLSVLPCTDPPCVQTARAICLNERNAAGGQAYIAYSDPTDCAAWRDPDRVYVRYLAGKPRAADGRMDRRMADIVAHLAASLLPNDALGCERSARLLHWWRSLPTDADVDGHGARPVTIKEIDTPFGERRGAVWAWQRVKMLKQSGASYL